MATGTIAPFGKHQFLSDDGYPLSGGKLFTYAAGTTTPLATYSDVGLTTPNPNPVILDAAGRCTLFLTAASYKWALKTSADVTVWTQDGIGAVPNTNVDSDIAVTAGEALTAGNSAYISDGSGGLTAGRAYKTDADLVYASSGAGVVGVIVADIASGESGSMRVGGRITSLSGLTIGAPYYVSATAGALVTSAPTNARLVGVADSLTSLVVTANPAPSLSANAINICEGRLTLTTATPVTTSDVTGAGTIYFTPYKGNRVSLFDGSRWRVYAFAEISLALTVTSGTNYDVFLYDNAGTLTLETLAWSSDTARATALTTQNGVLVKTGATTRRYVGTIRASGSNVTEDSFAKRFVWNYCNRVSRPMRVVEATNSWVYSSTTYQQANNSTANQLDFVVGFSEDQVTAHVLALTGNNTVDATGHAAIGLDANIVVANSLVGHWRTPVANHTGQAHASWRGFPGVGRHTLRWLERASGGTQTWYGDNGDSTTYQSGIHGEIRG